MCKYVVNIFGVLLVLCLLAIASPRAADMPDDLHIDLGSLVVSKSELICLALNDYWESRGEPLRGRVAVAQVVLNRAMDRRYPMNVCDVVKQNKSRYYRACQFSWWCDRRSDIPTDKGAWHRSLVLAAAMLSRDNGIVDNTNGALWYHATHIEPDWTSQLKRSVAIGGHVFYRDDVSSLPVEAKPDTFITVIRDWFISEPRNRFAVWAEEKRRQTQLAQN